uniref:Ubiquitin-like protease family profile domain-containing protein n=1 Tax=Oryza punctata TaxID=4537 RepID=A0A0E0MF77_ORYPU
MENSLSTRNHVKFVLLTGSQTVHLCFEICDLFHPRTRSCCYRIERGEPVKGRDLVKVDDLAEEESASDERRAASGERRQDQENCKDSDLDNMLFELHKKRIILNMKKKLMAGFSHAIPRAKVNKGKRPAKSEISFSRFSAKYFSEVVSSLSPLQVSIVKKYGFQNLLLFDSHFVPKKFATWIAKRVDIKSSEIVFNDKVIPLTKESFVLSKFGLSAIPSVKYFGDQLMRQKDLSEDKVITSFLIVALACFLCPNSSLTPSIKYLTIFEDVNALDSHDWSKFVLDWSLTCIKKFQKSNNLAGCLYYWAPGSTQSKSKDFRDKLEVSFGNMLPCHLKDKISDMFISHCSRNHRNDTESCEDVILSILALLSNASNTQLVQHDDNIVGQEFSPTTLSPVVNKGVLFADDLPIVQEREHISSDRDHSSAVAAAAAAAVTNNYPDVVYLGETKFSDKSKSQSFKTDEVYNASLQITDNSQGPSSLLMNSGASTSGGKLPPHGPRRILIPSKHSTHPYVTNRRHFQICDKEIQYYNAICFLADSEWQSANAININNVCVTFDTLGHSMVRGGDVSSSVMSAFYRFMFQNNHPFKSKKNYFFPSIGISAQLVMDLNNAALFSHPPPSALDRMVVFLDSLHERGHNYFENIMTLMINNFQYVWDECLDIAIDFTSFRVVFLPVPRQSHSCDSGIFVMKCIELWSPRILLPNEFDVDDISNIRVQYVNKIFFHPKNKMLNTQSEDLVLNWSANDLSSVEKLVSKSS